VAPGDFCVEILQEADAAAAAVGGELEEVELVRDSDCSREVGKEDEARFEGGDEDRVALGVVAGNVGAELGDAAADLLA
jgi:hypothetical protein